MRYPRKKGKVHFLFKSHGDDEHFGRGHNFSTLPKTYLFESAFGHINPEPRKKGDIHKLPNETRNNKTRIQALLDLHAKGVTILPGEAGRKKEIERLHQLIATWYSIGQKLERNPTLENIKEYVKAHANMTQSRHDLVRAHVKELIREGKTPVESQYGTNHSILSAELRKIGIPNTRTIFPRVKSHFHQVIFKKMRGKPVSDKEYQQALASAVLLDFLAPLTPGKLKDAKDRFLTLFTTALIENLDPTQLTAVIQNPQLVLRFNGLPEKPTTKQIQAFLENHSLFWKRLKAHQEMKKQLAKKSI